MKLPLSLSLSLRLGLAFALVVALSSGALGVYLYQSFARQLEQRDEVQLLGKLRQLRQLLGNAATPQLLLDQPQYLRDTMSGESNALIRVRDAAGNVLLDFNPLAEPLPAMPVVELAREPARAELRHWQTGLGTPAAAVAAEARLGAGTVVEITVARLYQDRADLLAAYRQRIVLGALSAALVAAALAGLMVWRGLLPLRRLADQAGEINAQRLWRRLDAQDAPPEAAGMVEAFNQMLDRLEQGFAQLNQFSADLAHELRTPLGNLIGQSQVALARPRSAEDYQALLESNLEELERLNRMSSSMLFLARAEHQAVALQQEPLDLAQEFQRQADYFQDLAEERELRIDSQVQADFLLHADPTLLRRALANLLSNALRHARPGSTITLAGERHSDGSTVIRVDNDGPPLPQEVLDRLFERFYRGDPARPDSSHSNGLGLAIVRSVMELHDGQASVRQESACISFRLQFPA